MNRNIDNGDKDLQLLDDMLEMVEDEIDGRR
jgi:hypothetical protein